MIPNFHRLLTTCVRSESDENTATLKLTLYTYSVRCSTVTSVCSPQQLIIHHAVTWPRLKVDHCLKKDKYLLPCVNSKQLLMQTIICKEAQCMYVWIYHVVRWPRLKVDHCLKKDKYLLPCVNSKQLLMQTIIFKEVQCMYMWIYHVVIWPKLNVDHCLKKDKYLLQCVTGHHF